MRNDLPPDDQQLIDAMCTELNNKVAPAITDPTVQVQLEMAISVLQTTAVRSANELAWMQEERDAIEEGARQLLDALPDAKALQEALEDLRRRQTTASISRTPRPTTRGPARCCRAPSRRPTSPATPRTSPPSAG